MYNVTSVDKIVKVPMLRISCQENDSPSWGKDATEGDYIMLQKIIAIESAVIVSSRYTVASFLQAQKPIILNT